MRACKLCNESTSWWRSTHKECKQKKEQGLELLSSLSTTYAKKHENLEYLEKQIEFLKKENFITEYEVFDILIQAFHDALDYFLSDNKLTVEEEKKLEDFRVYFDLPKQAKNLIKEARIVRTLMNGEEIEEVKTPHPFKLQKSEKLICVLTFVDYYKVKTKRHYEGGYAGASVRVAKGVYIRTGGFKGYPVESEQLQHLGIGTLGITTKHLYFSYGLKSFRIKHEKILSIQTTNEHGILIQRDGARALPEIFRIGRDTDFLMNILHLLG